MNIIRLLMVALLVLALFCGCEKPQPEQPETAPKAETQTEEKTPSEETEEKPEKEYPDVIETAISTAYLTPESIETNTPCQVRVLKVRDLEKTEEIYYDLCVEVDTGTKLLKKKLVEYSCFAPKLDGIRFADVDGDGTEELILRHDTGGNGGRGIYNYWVIKVGQEDLYVLFSSDAFSQVDTGFESRFVSGYQMEVKNRLCDYSVTFGVKEAYKTYFDEKGEPTDDGKIMLDPIYEFVPQDADGDGKYEIACKQYASYLYHNECTGIACCILEFNTATNEFELTDAWFEPETDVTSEKDDKEIPDVIECATVEGYVTQESLDTGTICRVYMTKERDKENPSYKYSYDLYISVDMGEKVFKQKMETCVSTLPVDSMYLGDVDGDGVQEIFTHNNTGGVGGFGLWRVWVLKFDGDELDILFENFNEFDTGFESRFLEDYQLEVSNHLTDYKLVFSVKESHRKYLEELEGMLKSSILVDPFYEFMPEDVDHDGISEVVCKQYTSIISHMNYTGTACSILKFNTNTQKFEVVDAWYEPYMED